MGHFRSTHTSPDTTNSLVTALPFTLFIMSDFLPRHTEGQEPQCEDSEQDSVAESNMSGMLELSDEQFKIIMINMLSALLEKSRQHARTGKQRDVNSKKRILATKNTNINEELSLMGSLAGWKLMRKQSLSLRTCQQKL